MTGLAQSTRVAEPSRRDVIDDTQPLVLPHPERPAPPRRAPLGRWRGIGWLAGGLAGALAMAWFIFLSPGEIGTRAEWFFGAAIFCVVMVSMWQTITIQRQAIQNAEEAARRSRKEFSAAEARSARELALTRALHQAEMDAQQNLHRAEMAAQQELARVEHVRLRQQLEKQALIEVSRAVNAHTRMLATLWNEGASVLRIEDRDEREQAMNPIFEQISQVVNDFSVELSNAHLLVQDDRLHKALDLVNEAAVMAVRVAEEVHVAVLEGHAPQPNPIPPVQRLLHSRAAEARRLAWDLLRNGLDESRPQTANPT